MSDAAHSDVSLEIDLDGVELKNVITPQDFLPGGSSDWARLRFAGLERGKELVVSLPRNKCSQLPARGSRPKFPME